MSENVRVEVVLGDGSRVDITEHVSTLLDSVLFSEEWYDESLRDEQEATAKRVADLLGVELPDTWSIADNKWRMAEQAKKEAGEWNYNYDEYDQRFIGPLRKPHDWDEYHRLEAAGLLPSNSVYEYDYRWSRV